MLNIFRRKKDKQIFEQGIHSLETITKLKTRPTVSIPVLPAELDEISGKITATGTLIALVSGVKSKHPIAMVSTPSGEKLLIHTNIAESERFCIMCKLNKEDVTELFASETIEGLYNLMEKGTYCDIVQCLNVPPGATAEKLSGAMLCAITTDKMIDKKMIEISGQTYDLLELTTGGGRYFVSVWFNRSSKKISAVYYGIRIPRPDIFLTQTS